MMDLQKARSIIHRSSYGDAPAKELIAARVALEAYDELRAAIDRGGWDLSACGGCGEPVVCLPDGLPMCETCVAQTSTAVAEHWKGPRR